MQPMQRELRMLVARLPDGCGVVRGVVRPCGHAAMVDAQLKVFLTTAVGSGFAAVRNT